MSYRPKALLVADLPKLQEVLQRAGYEIVPEVNPSKASNLLTQGWFHVVIIHLPLANNAVDAARLELAMRSDVLVPKIVLTDQTLDPTSQIVRDVLIDLDHPAPAVAFLSQTEENVLINTAEKAIRKHLGINPELEILPGREIFYTLAGWLKPDDDPKHWVGELEDLFRILFHDSTRIRVEWKEHLSRKRGEICTVWVQPVSEVVPTGHPLLVKCGKRESIERARESYERFFFRVTPTRLAGFARTTHFAAAALPAPAEAGSIAGNFPEFYRRKSEEEVCRVITLFTEQCKRWVQQATDSPNWRHKDLRELYLDRLGLREQIKVGGAIQELVKRAPDYGLWVEQVGNEIGFRFKPREKSHFYPHPLPYLYGEKSNLWLRSGRLCITHGDLRNENFCVDPEGIIWLDGYENMDIGPVVTDAAGLEAILKFHCAEEVWSVQQLYQFERISLLPSDLNELNRLAENPNRLVETGVRSPEMQRLFRIIVHLRNQWAAMLPGPDLQEYYASMFFFTMRELLNEEISLKRKLHALLSAAMLCYRLEHWADFVGWPGPKQVAV